MKPEKLIASIEKVDQVAQLLNSSDQTISLKGVSGSLMPVLTALNAQKSNTVQLVVCDDAESAGYYCNDVYNVLSLWGDVDEGVFLLPSSYKRSMVLGSEVPANVAARTSALSAVSSFLSNPSGGPMVICTYPEGLIEMVASRERLNENTLRLGSGERVDREFIEETLQSYGFKRVEFVGEPGEYATRGGILDLFSFSSNTPFRLEFFDQEIESIRSFSVSTQLSLQKVETIEIVPNINSDEHDFERVSLVDYIGSEATMWLIGGNNTFAKIDELRKKLLKTLDEPSTINTLATSVSSLTLSLDKWKLITAFGTLASREPMSTIDMLSVAQPSFGKNFNLLVDTVRAEAINGKNCYILSENLAQMERLEDIFDSVKGEIDSNEGFTGVSLTLHGGFSIANHFILTDHQIFERHHKYKIHNKIEKSVGMTISELNTLRIGDFVVHIDHGVGRFGGLVRQMDGGVQREYLKLNYRDNDVLMVGVHNLNRISKFKSSDAEVAPKVHKLGGGVWAKAKAVAKTRVKEMARELIALYAKRKASLGFAYSPDSYLQQELEASFIYEDTPDQNSTTRAIKVDMEAPQPMDRLVCGDVGFGKTEIAIRAAFKAATDGKQVAVLVPTTVLSLQHYRSFTRRLKRFPVRIENLSRAKSTKETNEIIAELEQGKIDIIIGTHKILSKSVKFKDLGLLIVDEEQKFGVAGKEKLRQFKSNIDTLTLTATPIPRTLQFSLMGARDMSIIATPPPNRQAVHTEVHPFDDELLKEALELELARGGQAFVLHNRVNTIEMTANKIRSLIPNIRVGVGHGQMPPKELEKVMMEFIYGEYDVLVATTIIESGIDIPNANTIIINNAHMFGLSDLHQLRGRVGRTNKKAYCYLLVPSIEALTGDAARRLRAIEEFSDLGSGFNIAMQDLDIRGAGNILGGEQSGFVSDIGYDTYQKIINEAVAELKAEQGLEVEDFATDTIIESDSSAYLPDEYVGSTNEKIRLYRELDGLSTDDQLEAFIERLTDRFGSPPPQAEELFDVVRLRAVVQKMAVEKLTLKSSRATLYFSDNDKHPYYSSPSFQNLLGGVAKLGDRARITSKGSRVVLSFLGVESFEGLRRVLEKFFE